MSPSPTCGALAPLVTHAFISGPFDFPALLIGSGFRSLKSRHRDGLIRNHFLKIWIEGVMLAELTPAPQTEGMGIPFLSNALFPFISQVSSISLGPKEDVL